MPLLQIGSSPKCSRLIRQWMGAGGLQSGNAPQHPPIPDFYLKYEIPAGKRVLAVVYLMSKRVKRAVSSKDGESVAIPRQEVLLEHLLLLKSRKGVCFRMRRKEFRNEGKSKSEKLQNEFTKYLSVALTRNRTRYIKKKMEDAAHCVLMEPGHEDENGKPETDPEPCLEKSLPHSWVEVLDRIEDEKLYRLLCELTPAETMVLFQHTIRDLPYKEVEKQTGVSSQTLENQHYGAIRKMKQKLR